ncbi:hypothetical protein [Hyunsoonleella ulvae]|uniref:hypothetical protein n=1 Tax=Hyunsoonleella ulvae TaxID=2799948 RepID=UPI0019393354|nr:hypothetical protein [Hyunsoonleella ulvae]
MNRMRLVGFVVLLLIVSCSKITKQENYEKQFEAYYKQTMYNPDSFKLIGSTVKEGSIYHDVNKEFLKALTEKQYTKAKNDSLIQKRIEHQHQVFFKTIATNAVGVQVQNIVSGYFIDDKLVYVDDKIVE